MIQSAIFLQSKREKYLETVLAIQENMIHILRDILENEF